MLLNYLSMVFMALLWAGAYVVGKLAVSTTVSPEMVAFFRFFIAGIVLLIITAIWEPASLKLKRGDWLMAAALGATGFAGYNLFFFWGFSYSPASDAAMIIPTLNPLTTLIAAALLLGEPLTGRKIAGGAISLIGQVLIFWTLIQAAVHDRARLLGDLFFVGSALFFSTYIIISRIAAKRFTPLGATTWGSIFGAVLLLPFALISLPRSSGYNGAFWIEASYLGIFGTVVAFLIWSRGVVILGASRASAFINLVPVSTLALAAMILGERAEWLQIMGMLIVLGGVYLAGTAPRRAVVGES